LELSAILGVTNLTSDELSFDRHRCFGRACRSHLYGSRVLGALKMERKNSSEMCIHYLPFDTTPYPRRLESSHYRCVR